MAEKRVQLCLVIHNHQPVGNFDHVIRDACDRAYLPFLRTLLDFPKVKIGLHTSGCLLEWMEQGCPEYFELVRELLKRGQLELLGGGMYEPILPILPDRDAVWQLGYMSDYLEEHFGQRPAGMWLAERVWEPHVPALMHDAGYRYTLLDDFHFRGSALPSHVESGYFETQHGEARVALLPISETLRYSMPFKLVEDTFEHLRPLGGKYPYPLQVFGDDGEKFGVWPETYEWVYERGWLKDFFTALTENLNWVELSLPAEVFETRRPAAEAYIPCLSYQEMGEWTGLDPDAGHDDPPGHWRNYLAKYSEAQDLYDRMLQVSCEMTMAGSYEPRPEFSESYAQHLGRGQCNCAYWHGVFGGLYLNNLRHALNSELLLAEKAALGIFPRAIDAESYMAEARPIARLRNENLNVQLNTYRGLCLDHFDQYDPPFVWTNVLTRRKEHYHKKLGADYVPDEHASIHDRVVTKEEGLEERLVYDSHPRCSFNCYLAPAVETPEQFLSVTVAERTGWARQADDFYSVAADVKRETDAVEGLVVIGKISLRKRAELSERRLQLQVSQARNGDKIVAATRVTTELLWVEFNFNVLTDQADDRYLLIDGERHSLAQGCLGQAAELRLCDGWQQRQLVLSCGQPEQVVVYPIYTVSSSEGGFERTYQGSCFMLGFPLAALDAGIELTIVIEDFHYAG